MIELREYQKRSVENLIKAIFKYGSAIDASETGVGKTYVAVEVARRLGLYTTVISPKSSIWKWEELLKKGEVKEFTVVTLEKFQNMIRQEKYQKGLLIWDECHRGQANYNTKTAKMMASIHFRGFLVLLLSATAVTNPLRMRATASILKLTPHLRYFQWILVNGCKSQPFGGYKFIGNMAVINKLHENIFGEGKGVRIRIKDLPSNEFPDNDIIVEPIEIEDSYEEDIRKTLKEIINDSTRGLGDLVIVRKKIETSKIDYIYNKAKDIIDEEKSVVIFLNYVDNIIKLTEDLNADNYKTRAIYGDISETVRQDIIESFTANDTKALVVQLSCGGVSLSLHDTTGERPRVSLISPDFSAVNLKQALGRIYRNGGKSKCVQRIIVARNTIEEHVIYKLERGIKQIALGNDGALENEDLLDVFKTYKIERRDI